MSEENETIKDETIEAKEDKPVTEDNPVKEEKPVAKEEPAKVEPAKVETTAAEEKTVEKPKTTPTGSSSARVSSSDTPRPRQSRPPYKKNENTRYPRFRRKVCRFCHEKNLKIDYKDGQLLEKFITDRGKILPRRSTGTCAKHQRAIAVAIKRARIIAILPFVEK